MKGHLVAALAHPPLSIFELSYAAEVFGRKRDELDVPWYDLAVGAIEPGLITSLGGLRSLRPRLAALRQLASLADSGDLPASLMPSE